MRTSFYSLVKSFAREERGASFVEYALLTGLMVVVVAAALALMTPGLNGIFTDINTRLLGAIP